VETISPETEDEDEDEDEIPELICLFRLWRFVRILNTSNCAFPGRG
jgi:hypothetical protein